MYIVTTFKLAALELERRRRHVGTAGSSAPFDSGLTERELSYNYNLPLVN